jgi:signal transduction histidine kinase
MRTDIDYLKARFQAHADMINGLGRIEEQMDRISVVIRIIPILRGGPDYFTPRMEKVSLRAILDRSVKTVKAEGNVAGILFKVSERGAFCNAYRPLLEQAIVNVLKNSVEAIREAQRERGIIEIEVRRDPASPDSVRVEIKDNGCGILLEHMSKVTTLFTTKSSTKPNSGLGLFLTRRIVKLHKGTLEIESIPKEGTIVSLVLPIWKPEERRL